MDPQETRIWEKEDYVLKSILFCVYKLHLKLQTIRS